MTRTAYRDTEVQVSKSQEQIKKLLQGQKVNTIRFTSFPSYALLEFVRETKEGSLPYRITVKPKIAPCTRSASRGLERAERQVWRAVYWWLKAKFEAIDFGLVEFEHDFLPYMLLERGTVSDMLLPRLAELRTGGDPFTGLLQLPQGQGADT